MKENRRPEIMKGQTSCWNDKGGHDNWEIGVEEFLIGAVVNLHIQP